MINYSTVSVCKVFKKVIENSCYTKILYRDCYIAKRAHKVDSSGKQHYSGLSLIWGLFGGKEKFYKLPVLDIGNKMGGTGYIDFIKPEDMSCSIMRGKDKWGRLFFVIKVMEKSEIEKFGIIDKFLTEAWPEEFTKENIEKEKELKYKKEESQSKKDPKYHYCQAFFCRNSNDTSSWSDGGVTIIKTNGYLINYGRIKKGNETAYEELKTLIQKKEATVDKNTRYVPTNYVLV